MTKFILVGGYPHKAKDGGKEFCEELVRGFKEPVKILDCLFARPQDNWIKAFDQDKEFFYRNLPHTQVELQLANPVKFIEQVTRADATYIRGGTEELLLAAFLKNTSNLFEVLRDKTLAGSSAGADVMGKYYYGLGDLTVKEGLGLLPIKVLVHYKSDYNAPNIDWDKAKSDLTSHGEDLPVLTLAEGQFEVRMA